MPIINRGRHRKPSVAARSTAAVAVATALTATAPATATADELEPVRVGPQTQEIAIVRDVPAEPAYHPVVPGDTLSEIAEDNDTSWNALWDLNRDRVQDPNLIFPGQEVRLNSPGVEDTQALPVVVPKVAKDTASQMVVKPAEPVVQASPKNSVVDAAKAYLGRGIQYVWGGKSAASGVDCSGFVWLALKDAGYKVPYRTSAALKAWTTPVSKANAKPGDLVFWPGHVEIYLGDNKSIGAANPQIDLGIHNLYGSPTFGRIPA